MFWTRVIISLVEFLLSFFLAVFIVYWSYRSFQKFNHDYDAQKEIYKGNVAVATLMAALMYSAALIMRESIYPVIGTVTIGLTSGGESGYGLGTLAGYVAGHLCLGFLLAVGCVQVAVKLFERLTHDVHENLEIAKGNTAIAIVMAAVVIVVSTFMQHGVGAVTKSLIPQPKLGSMRMMDAELE